MSLSSTAINFTPLTPIEGEPDTKTMKLLKAELFSNAMNITSNRGGGDHGHLSLLMSEEAYLAIAGTAFVVPVNPGASPEHAANATSAQITETNRQFLSDQVEYLQYRNVERELKRLLLGVVSATYVARLRHSMFGFSNCTTRDLLDHLVSRYGVVTPAQLEANAADLLREWHPDTSIELLWARRAAVQEFAAEGGDPITDAAAIRKTITVLENTGVFDLDLRDWHNLPEAEQTVPQLELVFTRANKERLRRLTAKQAGYHGANAATQHDLVVPPPNLPPSSAMSPPALANAAISEPPRHYYCWTHGLGINRAHTSITCNHKATGHRDEAVMGNMLGGNNTMQRSRNEVAVYRAATPGRG